MTKQGGAAPPSSGRRIARALAGALVGLTTGAAVVGAHGSDTTRIHACKAPDGVLVRVSATTESCPNGGEPVDWNIAGPAGPLGPKGSEGPAGAQGAAGAEGPAGADSDLRLRTEIVTSGRPDWGYYKRLTAKCRPGEHVVGGGYRFGTDHPDEDPFRVLELWGSVPEADGSGWTVDAARHIGNTVQIPWSLTVFAACAPQGVQR